MIGVPVRFASLRSQAICSLVSWMSFFSMLAFIVIFHKYASMTARGRSLIYLPRRRPVCVRRSATMPSVFMYGASVSFTAGPYYPSCQWVVEEWSYEWVEELAYRPDRIGD